MARGVETVDGQAVTASSANNASSSDVAQATEPTGAISLPDAIARQLGLKLELQKLTVPMLVLDHIERQPTEN